MKQYRVKFSVNGNSMETIIAARDSFSARKMIEAQYSAAGRVVIFSVFEVR